MNSKLVFRNIGRFLLLILLQTFVLNNVYLGGYINPFLYVLFIIMLPTNTNRIAMLVLSFATGLCIDLGTNMLGFHAFACTVVGFMRILWADKIILRDNEEVVDTPSIHSGSYQQFAIYLFFLLLIFNFVYYLLVMFSLRELPSILLSTLLSTIVTWILAILYQTLFFRKPQSNDKR